MPNSILFFTSLDCLNKIGVNSNYPNHKLSDLTSILETYDQHEILKIKR